MRSSLFIEDDPAESRKRHGSRLAGDRELAAASAMAVYETTISERAKPDWEQELRLARAEGGPGAVQLRPNLAVPRMMNWDGLYGRPDAVAQGDVFCFVLSAYAPPKQPAEMAVYRVVRTLGRTHGSAFDTRAAGRPGWTDRLSGAIELRCAGHSARGRVVARPRADSLEERLMSSSS